MVKWYTWRNRVIVPRHEESDEAHRADTSHAYDLHRLKEVETVDQVRTSQARSRGTRQWLRRTPDDERKKLLEVCNARADPSIHCAVALALATGARLGSNGSVRSYFVARATSVSSADDFGLVAVFLIRMSGGRTLLLA